MSRSRGGAKAPTAEEEQGGNERARERKKAKKEKPLVK